MFFVYDKLSVRVYACVCVVCVCVCVCCVYVCVCDRCHHKWMSFAAVNAWNVTIFLLISVHCGKMFLKAALVSLGHDCVKHSLGIFTPYY